MCEIFSIVWTLIFRDHKKHRFDMIFELIATHEYCVKFEYIIRLIKSLYLWNFENENYSVSRPYVKSAISVNSARDFITTIYQKFVKVINEQSTAPNDIIYINNLSRLSNFCMQM